MSGELIKEIRKKMGYSQLDLADQMAVRQSFISMLEKNQKRMSIDNAIKFIGIAKQHKIKVTLDQIFGE